MEEFKPLIEKAWENRELLKDQDTIAAINGVVEALDKGQLRVAKPVGDEWVVLDWVKKAVILYFPTREMETLEAGPMEFYDKIKLKTGYDKLGIRVVPHAVARYGAYISRGVVMMPSYINIGAYVDAGTMVDTWATVGSCAQIGKNVHLSGGVGVGGVLEPVQAAPVIIEDNAFIGSRCILVEGVRIGKEAVLGANVTLTASTKIIDVTSSPLSDFTAPEVCQGELTQITNLTNENSTNITAWAWDFGDGSPISEIQDPLSHSYVA